MFAYPINNMFGLVSLVCPWLQNFILDRFFFLVVVVVVADEKKSQAGASRGASTRLLTALWVWLSALRGSSYKINFTHELRVNCEEKIHISLLTS